MDCLNVFGPNPVAQPIALWTGKQEVAGLIPRFCQYSFRGLMTSHCDRIYSSLSVISTIVMWEAAYGNVKKNCAEYWFKELIQSIIKGL